MPGAFLLHLDSASPHSRSAEEQDTKATVISPGAALLLLSAPKRSDNQTPPFCIEGMVNADVVRRHTSATDLSFCYCCAHHGRRYRCSRIRTGSGSVRTSTFGIRAGPFYFIKDNDSEDHFVRVINGQADGKPPVRVARGRITRLILSRSGNAQDTDVGIP